MASSFVGTILPAGVGGDVFRAVRTAMKGRKMDRITASIAVERVIGLLAVTVLALLGLAVLVSFHETQFRGLYYSVWFFFITLVIGLFLSTQTRTFDLTKRILSGLEKHKAIQMLLDFHGAYIELSGDRKDILFFCMLSILEQAIQVLIIFCAAKAIDLSIGIMYFVAISPLSILVTTLPISIGAIGVQEGAYIFLLGLAGVRPTDSLSLSFLIRVIGLIMLMPGGVVFVYDSMKAGGFGSDPNRAA